MGATVMKKLNKNSKGAWFWVLFDGQWEPAIVFKDGSCQVRGYDGFKTPVCIGEAIDRPKKYLNMQCPECSKFMRWQSDSMARCVNPRCDVEHFLS